MEESDLTWTVQLKRITYIASTFYVASILDYSWDEPSDFFRQATGAASVWPADGWCLRNPVGLSKRSPCQQNQKFRRRRGGRSPGGAGRPLSALPNLQAQNGGGISRWHSAETKHLESWKPLRRFQHLAESRWQGWRTLVPLYSYRPASQYFDEGPLSEHSFPWMISPRIVF